MAISNVRDGKFYQLLAEKKNTELTHNLQKGHTLSRPMNVADPTLLFLRKLMHF